MRDDVDEQLRLRVITSDIERKVEHLKEKGLPTRLTLVRGRRKK